MRSDAQFPLTLEAQLQALESDGEVLGYTAAREALAGDPARPLYHFSPPGKEMNDPNGLCQWQGRYHLFYQYMPVRQEPIGSPRQHRGISWGHTVSDDLVNWRDLPIALYPAEGELGCYSGQTLVDEDRVIATYHAPFAGNVITIASDPLLLNWEHPPYNPAIPGDSDPENVGVCHGPDGDYLLFDPCIWKEEDGYYSLSGTYTQGSRGGTRSADCLGVVHIFYSPDLTEWQWLGPMVSDEVLAEPGEDMAVPNFWPIGNGRHMLLLFSHKHAGRYYIGHYDRVTHRFHPETHGRMNYGPWTIGSLHAPSATVDASGRYLGIFNVKEGRDFRGWNDIMSLPRHYWLADDNTLRMAPVPELEGQRFDGVQLPAREIAANSEQVLEPSAVRRSRSRPLSSQVKRARSASTYCARRTARNRRASPFSRRCRIGAPTPAAADRHVAVLAGGRRARPPAGAGAAGAGVGRGAAFAHLHRPQHHRGLRQRQTVPDPARLSLTRGQRGRVALRPRRRGAAAFAQRLADAQRVAGTEGPRRSVVVTLHLKEA